MPNKPFIKDSNTLCLLQFNESVTKDEIRQNIWTNPNNCTLDTTLYKFGNSSLYLGNYGVLKLPYTNKFNFNQGDFTIEWWWRQPVSGDYYNGPAANIYGQNASRNMLIHIMNGYIYLGQGNNGYQSYAPFTRFTDGEFHYYKVERQSGIVSFYEDDTLKGSGNNNYDYNNIQADICLFGQGDHNFTYGHIDSIKISKPMLLSDNILKVY